MASEPNDKNSELIGKLIQKRKEENEAFKKLLSAIEELGEQPILTPTIKSSSKRKTSKKESHRSQ